MFMCRAVIMLDQLKEGSVSGDDIFSILFFVIPVSEEILSVNTSRIVYSQRNILIISINIYI